MITGPVQSAYGLTISGLPQLPELTPGPCPGTDSRVLILVDSTGSNPPEPRELDADAGVRRLADGRVLALDRATARATFFGPPLAPDVLAHPYLGPVATTFNRWAGRETFHAGSFVAHDRAWVVLGPRTAGKSTLMACLADAGYPVLSDDIAVTDGQVVHPGPRCLDLREIPPGSRLAGQPARQDSRQRMLLPAAPGPMPLGGWLFLAWDDELSLTVRGAAQLLADLAARRSWRQLQSDPTRLLALSTLPAWTLSRPKRWDAVPATLELIDRTLGRAEWPAPLSTVATR